MDRPPGLDCVLIGPHEPDFDRYAEGLRAMGEDSIAYRMLKTNSTVVDGRRTTYFGLLNRLLAESTGAPCDLHVFRLPNLAVAHLATALHRAGLSSAPVNFFTQQQGLLLDLLAERPAAVAVTSTFSVDNDALAEVVGFVREHAPDVPVIVGGPHILNVHDTYDTGAQDFVLTTIGADVYICDAQGEATLVEVLRALRRAPGSGRAALASADLAAVPNLVHRPGGSAFVRTPRVPENTPIEDAIVDWSLFDRDFYAPTVQLRTARSCAYSCAFCRYPQVGGPLTLNDLDTVRDQLRYLADAGVRSVIFIDDTFNVPFPRFKRLLRMMIAEGFGFDWYSFFRCANSDAEAFDLMAASGCRGVFLGVESGDDGVLRNMNKSASSGRYRRGIAELNARGILSCASLVVGFPGETRDSLKNTVDLVSDAGPTFYRAEMYYHYQGVPVAAQADRYGLRGSGYHWRHDTMDAEEACAAVEEMYRTVDRSLVLPGYMFDFWSVAYLLGHGMPLEHLTAFVRRADEAMVGAL